MNDPEIEDLLRRYRPAGPSSDLRARILGDTTPVGRTWPWAVAAAVLLAATLYLHAASNRLAVGAGIDVSADSKSTAIIALSEMLGGGPSARTAAELTIAVDTIRTETPSKLNESSLQEGLQ
jgi:hypothetical protein